jgi:hypothetical protein
MANERERPADEDAVAPDVPTGDVLPEPEGDEVSGYTMSVPRRLNLSEDEGSEGEGEEVQT